MRIAGPIFAIVTPFDAKGEVVFDALNDYLRFLGTHGVQTIVVNGTTGEFASLTVHERMQILERCRRGFGGAVICHVSSCACRDCQLLLNHARHHADAALLLPPFYYANVDEAGCLAFFREVLRTAPVPVYLYNFPEHTQLRISPDALAALAGEYPHLVGIKDSGGDVKVSQAYKRACPAGQVFVGGDRCALAVLELGLDGSVTGCGNPVPEFLVRLAAQFKSHDRPAAMRTQQAFDVWTDFRESVGIDALPVTKAAIAARIPGFPIHVRPPFVTMDEAQARAIRSAMRDRILPLIA